MPPFVRLGSRVRPLAAPTLLAVLLLSAPLVAQPTGVEVHGHWTITVLEPDGTVVSRLEFENALVASGRVLLAEILTGAYGAAYWQVALGADPSGSDPDPCVFNAQPTFCVATPPGTGGISNTFETLTTTLGGNGDEIHLAGQVTAATSTTIGAVATSLHSTDPAAYGSFTEKILSSPAAVQAGQVVQVTVEISFS